MTPMLRKFFSRLSFFLVLFTITATARAQSWSHVKVLPVGAELHINLQSGRLLCSFLAADDKSIACETHRRAFFFFTVRQHLVFARESVVRIRVSRQTLSTLAGLGIGVAGGVGIGAIIDSQAKNQAEEGHLAATLFGLLGAGVGATVGNRTDFLPGSTIYQAP